MPAVHPDLAAGTASFIFTPTNADLICRREVAGTGNFKTKINAVYRLNSEVTFIGAETSENATAVMPSHQANDLLLVFAFNGNGTGIPIAPSGEGWETIKTNGVNPNGYHLAYKFAATNTQTVGPWVGSTRTTAVVYRNVRKIPNDTSSSKNFLSTKILYPSIATENSGGTRVVYFSTSKQNLDSALTPADTTTRISTQAISGSAPGIGLHDRLLPNGTELLGGSNTIVTSTKSQVVAIELLSGVPEIQAQSVGFTTGLNGDIFKNRLSLTSRPYNVTLPQVFWSYKSYYTANSATFSHSISPVVTPRGYFSQFQQGDFHLSVAQAIFARYLIAQPASGGFAFTEGLIDFAKGFFANAEAGVFSATFYDTLLTHFATLQALSGKFDVTHVSTALQRALIEALAAAIFNSTTAAVGIRNDAASSPSGGPFKPAAPFHLQPSLVQYNSISKSRDLGVVSNFLGLFAGKIGSQTGAPSLFFKLKTLGPADLRIQKKSINKYTDGYISVAIADANRKPVSVNDFGFAYQNEILNTEIEEFALPMPAGEYYFIVSSSQWQELPFSIEIQAIRFSSLSGVITLTNQSLARFAISKMKGAAPITGPFQATIPTASQLKQPTGPVLLTSGSRGALTTPEGLALMRMLPTGRLKMTHKITGTASISGTNVATLSSAPPYGGGYGP
jgi:hypothetical protein